MDDLRKATQLAVNATECISKYTHTSDNVTNVTCKTCGPEVDAFTSFHDAQDDDCKMNVDIADLYRNVTAEWSQFGCNPPNVNKGRVTATLAVCFALFAVFYLAAWLLGPKTSSHDDHHAGSDGTEGYQPLLRASGGGGGGGGGGGAVDRNISRAESISNARRR